MPSETEQAFEQILSHEVTFRIHWNNIEARCNVTCLVRATAPVHYKQSMLCITGKFASRPPDQPRRNSGSPGWFMGRIWRLGDRSELCCTARVILILQKCLRQLYSKQAFENKRELWGNVSMAYLATVWLVVWIMASLNTIYEPWHFFISWIHREERD